MPIHDVIFPGSWLGIEEEAHVVLAQVRTANDQILLADGSRPWAILTASELLGAKKLFAQIVSGGKPAIIIMPELAFGSADWDAIDALVRGWTSPLIFIAGFGFTKGDRLIAWKNGGGVTSRRDDGFQPADDRLYNGGWCWVHKPGDGTACIQFIKTTTEQTYEIQVPELDRGTNNVVIHLDDLSIFPVICSDFLSVVNGKRRIQGEISEYLKINKSNKKILIAGLLLQKKASDKWRTAVFEMTNGISVDLVNISLANAAHEICAWDEREDQWRDYSGTFIAKGRKPREDHFSAVRRFTTDEIDGAVFRGMAPMVAGGPLRWAFTSATGKHLWEVQKDFGIEPNGSLSPSNCHDRFRIEALRLIKRMTLTSGSPAALRIPTAISAYTLVATHIGSTALPNAETVCKTVLYGDTNRGSTLTADRLPQFIEPVSLTFKSLGALKRSPAVEWQPDVNQRGQLTCNNRATNILVWCSPGSSNEMRQIIQRWKNEIGKHPPLIILKKTLGSSMPEPAPISDRRQDVSAAPIAKRPSVDEPAQRPLILERNLDDLDECFAHANENAFTAAVSAQIDQALKLLAGTV